MSGIANVQAQLTSNLNQQATLVSQKNLSEEQRDMLAKLREQEEALNEDLAMLRKIAEKLGVEETKRNERVQEEMRRDVKTVAKTLANSPAIISQTSATEEHRNRAALRSYLLGKNNAEARAIITSDTGSALVAQQFDSAIQIGSKFAGPITSLVKRHSGARPTKFAVSDSSNVKMIAKGEGTVAAISPDDGSNSFVQTPQTIFSTTPATVSLAATVEYSLQETQDADDLPGYLAKTFAPIVLSTWENLITNSSDGAGTYVGAGSAPAGGLLSLPVGTTTNTLASGVGPNDFVNLFNSFANYSFINPAVSTVGVSIHPSFAFYLLGLKDGFGRNEFTYNSQEGLKSIFGVPVVLNNSMPVFNPSAPVAGQIVAVAGDFEKGYNLLAGEANLVVLKERFLLLENLGAAVMYTRAATALGINGALKTLKLAAA